MITPPLDNAKNRRIRVFISSTFRDMQAERDELVKFVFPQLQKFCEQRGVAWEYVDLRWGVTEEQRAEGQVLKFCLQEINNCRPFFIGLLGERYGWIPRSDEIDRDLINQEPWLKDYIGCSVTELEILQGVLNNPQIANNAFFYFRDKAYCDSMPEKDRGDFQECILQAEVGELGIDEANRKLEDRKRKLISLKEKIRESGRPVMDGYPNPKSLGARVLQDFKTAIDALYPENETPDPLDRESFEQELFINHLSEGYIANQSLMTRLELFTRDDKTALILTGESGLGKSTLLANWILQYRKRHPDGVILFHFIGGSRFSTDWIWMLRRFVHEMNRRLQIKMQIPEQPEDLKEAFSKSLQLCTANQRVVVVIDGLNQLEDRDQAPDLVWLPSAIPNNLRLVLSTLPGRSMEEIERRGWSTFEIQSLSEENRKKMVSEYLARFSKSLTVEQIEKIAACDRTRNPLYLKTILDELRLFGIHDQLNERIEFYLEADSLDQLFKKVLHRYEEDYDRERPFLVRDTMKLIWGSRRGLTESELLTLLGEEDHPLPQAYWIPFYLAAGQTLVNRSGVISFSHDYLRRAVEQIYLPAEKNKKETHQRLADYFESTEYFESIELNIRKVDELPWQLVQAENWQKLVNVLSDIDFFKLVFAFRKFEFLSYWQRIEKNSDQKIVNAYRFVTNSPEQYFKSGYLPFLADLFFSTGHFDESFKMYEFVSNHSRNEGEQALAFNGQAQCLKSRGRDSDVIVAMQLMEAAAALYKEAQNMEGLIATLANLSGLYSEYGLTDQNNQIVEELDRLQSNHGDKASLSQILGNKASAALQNGNYRQAMDIHKKEEALLRENGDKDGLQISYGNQAAVYLHQGQSDEALELLKKQEQICQEIGKLSSLTNCYSNQAYAWFQKGDTQKALTLVEQAEQIAITIGDEKQQALAIQARKRILESRKY